MFFFPNVKPAVKPAGRSDISFRAVWLGKFLNLNHAAVGEEYLQSIYNRDQWSFI